MIVQNAAICNKCSDYIVSGHRHDFVTCECGAISVDGGQDYLRRSGDLANALDMSWSLPDQVYEDCITAVKTAIESNRNAHGIANAVMRKLRDSGHLIADDNHMVMAAHKDELMVVDPDGTINRYRKVVD